MELSDDEKVFESYCSLLEKSPENPHKRASFYSKEANDQTFKNILESLRKHEASKHQDKQNNTSSLEYFYTYTRRDLKLGFWAMHGSTIVLSFAVLWKDLH